MGGGTTRLLTKCIAWCRELFGAAAPHATGGVSVNFMTEEERERVSSAYGESLQRLREVKRAYDPGDLFRMNQSISPAD
jgi:FAD/FMN-containing dehydrogenase